MVNNEELIYWWRGYVQLKIKGRRLERLINRMMYQRLSAWNVVRLSSDEAQFSISVPDFFRLRPLLKETGCRSRIVRKAGLPFLLQKMGQRGGLYGGALLFVVMLYLFSSMIWHVEIEGITRPEQEKQVRETLEELGVKRWNFKFRAADPHQIRRHVLEQLDHVTWVGFSYKGTTAHLQVVEKTLPEQLEPLPNRNLVAKKKAVIHDLFVEKGVPMVKPNQYVRPGDLLVAGRLSKDDEAQPTPAKGKVWGEVWYVGEIEVPLHRERAVLSGEKKARYYLQIGPYKLQVWGFGQLPFSHYVTREKPFQLSVKGVTLPVAWVVAELMEADLVEEILDQNEAVQLGLALAREKMRARLPDEAEIVDENILKKGIDHGKVYIKIHYSVIEEISTPDYTSQGD